MAIRRAHGNGELRRSVARPKRPVSPTALIERKRRIAVV
jgi:hypothetical protein